MDTRGKEGHQLELVAVAKAVLEGELDLLEGVRKIVALRHESDDPEDEIFIPLRAIDSETDHFPAGSVRTHYAAEALERVDDEMRRYFADARSEILAACREIVRVYSPH